MEMEDEKGRVDLSSLTVDEDDDEEISTEEETDDEDGNSTDEDDDDDTSSSSEEEDGGADAGPPIHFAEDLASPPEWILLEVQGYIDARKNSTTAFACLSKGGGAIQVTFWAARPPRVSCFTVHWDGLKPGDELPDRPTVLAAEDDLVLLRVDRTDMYIMEYFVYQAAGATSTLRLLAKPPACVDSNEAGILRLRDGEFLVAALRVVGGLNCERQYHLHLFDSRTWTWTSRQMMRVDRFARASFRPTKVLAIGGERGSMAWVDLWQGILICDLLAVHDDDATLRYIPLPPSPNAEGCRCPSAVRDMAVVQGRIKFFEMRFKVKERAITSTASLVTRYWKATAWEKKKDPGQPRWLKDCGLDIFKVPMDKSHPELPARLHDMGKLHGEHPALSLHEEDVVYIMAKAKVSDRRRAWMLAVDVRKKTLRDVAAFDAGRAYSYSSHYLQSGLSSYLKVQSSTM